MSRKSKSEKSKSGHGRKKKEKPYDDGRMIKEDPLGDSNLSESTLVDRLSDDRARQEVDLEARKLIDELYQINKTLASGSIEREKREDVIYHRLYALADMIQQKHWTQKSMQDLYYLITNKNVAPPTLYDDDFQMFPRYPDDPKTHMFLEEIVKRYKLMKPEEAEALLRDPAIDGKKEILVSLMQNCQRATILNQGAAHTCKDCWKDILRNIFFMVAEMLTLELQNRSRQIESMIKTRDITSQNALELTKLLNMVAQKLDVFIMTADQIVKKKDWIQLVEGVFQLLIYMINEIMMKFVMSQQVNQNKRVEVLL